MNINGKNKNPYRTPYNPQLRRKDLDDLYEYLSDEEVVRFEPYTAMNLDDVKKNLEWRISSDEIFALELKENGKMIGNIFLGKRECETLELGYVLNRNFWGQWLRI